MRHANFLMLVGTAAIAAACNDESPTHPRLRPGPTDFAAAASKAPSKLLASATFMSISITWQDNSSDEDGFILERLASPSYEWQYAGTFPPNTTAAHDEALSSADQPIEYRVSAFNKDGRSTSNVDTAWVLNEPTNVAATVVDAHTIDITWTNNGRWSAGVEILRGPTSAGPFATIALYVAAPYRDAGLPVGTYWYIVRSRNGDSMSESVYAFASTARTPPNALTGFKVYPYGSSSLLGEWQPVRTNETGYRVEQSPDGSSGWTTNQVLNNAYWSGFTTPTVPEQWVCLRVIAFNSYGDAPPSNVACAAAPAPATQLTADIVSEGVQITWRDNSNFEAGYYVYRSTQLDENGYDAWEFIAEVGPNVTSFRETIPNAPSGYALYSVQPFRDGGSGDGSEPVSIMLPMPTSAQVAAALKTSPISRGNGPKRRVPGSSPPSHDLTTAVPGPKFLTTFARNSHASFSPLFRARHTTARAATTGH
jgi:titin